MTRSCRNSADYSTLSCATNNATKLGGPRPKIEYSIASPSRAICKFPSSKFGLKSSERTTYTDLQSFSLRPNSVQRNSREFAKKTCTKRTETKTDKAKPDPSVCGLASIEIESLTAARALKESKHVGVCLLYGFEILNSTKYYDLS